MRTIHIILLSAAALSLAGCSHEVSAPSLMPRAVEKQPIDMPMTNAIEADTPVDPALQAKIATQVAAAQAGDKAFTAQQAETDKAVARASGAAPGSDAWVEAQEAVTALASARAAVRDAAAAIDAAATGVTALETKEADAVAALNQKLG